MSDARVDVSFGASTAELEAGAARAAAAIEAMCASAIAALQNLAVSSAEAMAKLNQAMAGAGPSGGKKDPAKQQADSWRASIAEITGAESGFVRNIFSGRQTLSQSLIAMGRQVVESEIANDLKYYTTKVLYNLLGLQSDKMTAQGGFLAQLIATQQKSGPDGSGSHTARRRREWEDVEPPWKGTPCARRRITSAAATSSAAETTSTLSSITKHAASAAAAVYDSVAQIPYVGWVLAPIAAGAAFVAVEAYGALMPSFDTGAWNLPHDMVAQVHAGELVIPAGIAGSMRDFFAGGGADGGDANNVAVTFNVSAMDGASVLSTLKRNQGALMSVIRTAVRNGAALPAGAVR